LNLYRKVLQLKNCLQYVHNSQFAFISGERRQFPKGGQISSQINFTGSAKGTTILGESGDMPPGKFCKITPKNTHFCTFWKQVLANTVFAFFYF